MKFAGAWQQHQRTRLIVAYQLRVIVSDIIDGGVTESVHEHRPGAQQVLQPSPEFNLASAQYHDRVNGQLGRLGGGNVGADLVRPGLGRRIEAGQHLPRHQKSQVNDGNQQQNGANCANGVPGVHAPDPECDDFRSV